MEVPRASQVHGHAGPAPLASRRGRSPIVEFLLKALLSGFVVAFASWLAGRSPVLAGFFVALPISTALVLPLTYIDHGRTEDVVLLAKSIALAIPMTLSFFVPFFVAGRVGLGFWPTYALAFVSLGLAYLGHRWIATAFFAGSAP